MTPIKQLKEKLSSIADAIRDRTGDDDKLTLDQMVEEIDYMPVGDDGNAYILVDEEGNEIPAVLTEEEVDLTATPNDIREGVVAVTDDGVTIGEKEIPVYICREGYRVIPNGIDFTLPIDGYDYDKLQAIFCAFNTTMSNSVAADRVVINNNVYPVQSAKSESFVTKDHDNKSIIFGIKNTFDKSYLIRYVTIKEEY